MSTRRWLAVAAGLTLPAASPAADPPPSAGLGAPPLPMSAPAGGPGYSTLRANPVLGGTTAFGLDHATLPPAAEPCPEPCPAPCDTLCGPPGRVWVSGEWLYWTSSGNPLPVLVTAAPGGVPRAVAGTFGGPATAVLAGGERANNDDFRSGFRLRAGYWADPDQTRGWEGDFFFLGRDRERFAAGGSGAPLADPAAAGPLDIVTRPFVTGQTGAPNAQLVAFPGVLAGGVGVTSTTEVTGGGINYVCNHSCSPCGRLDWLVGYRYLNLRDDLAIAEDLTALAGSGLTPGTRIGVRDRFRTDNDFHGGVVGMRFERRRGRYFVGGLASVALGVSHQEVQVDGSTTFLPPGGPPNVLPGGLLAQPTNIGRYEDDEFAVVPEAGLRAGVQATDRLRMFVGYSFIYWSSVARAGDQVDLRVNTGQLPPARPLVGPAVPAFRRTTTDYWLQGISVGGELRF